jgi:hypothetical protein
MENNMATNTEKRLQAWTPIAELFRHRDGDSFSGEVRVACGLQLTNGCDLVISPIPEAQRRNNGPTHRAQLVRDLGPVPTKAG